MRATKHARPVKVLRGHQALCDTVRSASQLAKLDSWNTSGLCETFARGACKPSSRRGWSATLTLDGGVKESSKVHHNVVSMLRHIFVLCYQIAVVGAVPFVASRDHDTTDPYHNRGQVVNTTSGMRYTAICSFGETEELRSWVLVLAESLNSEQLLEMIKHLFHRIVEIGSQGLSGRRRFGSVLLKAIEMTTAGSVLGGSVVGLAQQANSAAKERQELIKLRGEHKALVSQFDVLKGQVKRDRDGNPKGFGTPSKDKTEKTALCNDFNRGRCQRKACIFTHACRECGSKEHGFDKCPLKSSN